MPELKMSNLSEKLHWLLEEFDSKLRDLIEEEMTVVNARELNLDIRAGYRLYIDSDHIIVDVNGDGSLQYYGGFEYIDKEYRQEVGGFVIYSREQDSDDGRVSECLDYYMGKQKDEDTEESEEGQQQNSC
jgi:hypothetical protein